MGQNKFIGKFISALESFKKIHFFFLDIPSIPSILLPFIATKYPSPLIIIAGKTIRINMMGLYGEYVCIIPIYIDSIKRAIELAIPYMFTAQSGPCATCQDS